MNGHLISVLCSKDNFETNYSFLFFKGYPVLHFTSVSSALASPEFFKSKIVILDSDNGIVNLDNLICTLKENSHHAQIILAWDFDHIPDSDMLLHLFYCIHKPVDQANLLAAVERACEKGLQWESRKDVRIPLNLPVDFFYNARIWLTSTTNLSLDGMQAVWPEPKLVGDILGRFRRDSFPFLSCRLYVEGNKDNPVHVPISLKYVADHEENGQTLMGFSFGDLPGNMKTKLYETIAD